MKQKVLVTGTSGGFGRLISETLLQQGHTVVASMRDSQGRNREVAEALQKQGAHIVEIDVTDDGSVAQGVEQAIDLAGGLDVLVNNAGVGVHGIQELFTVEDLRRVFDINLFGVQRMNRAVLPYFHQQQFGLLLHISSLLGRITIPFYGPYNASKWALEALVENYRTELSAFGIDAAMVEPGGFPTSFMDRLIHPSDTDRASQYGDFAQAPEAAFAAFQQALAANPAQNPQLVATAVAEVIDTPAGQRPFRTVVDKMGMGEPVAGYNDHLAQVTHGIYQAFGTDSMLTLNTKP